MSMGECLRGSPRSLDLASSYVPGRGSTQRSCSTWAPLRRSGTSAGWQFNCNNFRSSFCLKNRLSFHLSFHLIEPPKRYLFSTAYPILIQMAKKSAEYPLELY